MRVYFDENGNFIKATGSSIFKQSNDTNELVFVLPYAKGEDVASVSAMFLLPYGKNSGQYGQYCPTSLIMAMNNDVEDGVVWYNTIPAGYLNNSGTARLSARVVYKDKTIKTSQQVMFTIEDSGNYEATAIPPDTATQLDGKINDLTRLKQDKRDETLTTNDKTVVGAINYLNDLINNPENGLSEEIRKILAKIRDELEPNIAENTRLIGVNDGRIDVLERQAISGIDRIGRIVQNEQPTSEQLTQFVRDEAQREPRNGDYIEWVQPLTDKYFKIFYSNSTWQTPDEQPNIDYASNTVAGLIRGTFLDDVSTSVKVDVAKGLIKDILVKVSGKEYKGISTWLNAIDNEITDVITGVIAVAEATHSSTSDYATEATSSTNATNDGLSRDIVETYAEKGEVYTKDQADDKFLPNTYSKIYYYSNEGIVDVVPTLQTPQFTANVSSIGSTTLFDIDRVLLGSYKFNKNSTDNSIFWISTDRTCDLSFRLTTYGVVGTEKTVLAVDTTEVISFTANSPKSINLKTIYNQLGEREIELATGNKIEKKLEIISDFSTPTKVDFYCNETYPSTFILVTQSITLTIAELSGKKVVNIAEKDWVADGNGNYKVTLSAKDMDIAPTTQYGMDLQTWNGYGWQRVLFTPLIRDNGSVTITSAKPIDAVLLVWIAMDIDKINEGGTRVLINGVFVPDLSLPANLPDMLEPIDLGNIKDEVEFDITPALVEQMFKGYDKNIHLKWSNYDVTLVRFDRSANEVFYSANMELEGTKYLYTLRIDKDTNKGLLERVEEDIIVDMGQHTLSNGSSFNITLANASKRNVVYIKIFDKATNKTRFFKKNWIDKDNTTFTFSEMWGNLVGQITITTADTTARYNEVVLADKDTASAMANRLKFNQLFDTTTSTLPTANGLTITNIYGGHHVVGTTDRQYYHKMYELATTQGHWYYFAPIFSNTKSVYILGHIDGVAFSTNKGKVFEGGSKFDAYIQIEKDKTMDFDVQPILVDLTEMFGSRNEPTTDTDVYQYIAPNTYYPYNDTNAFVTKDRASAEANRFRFNQLIPSDYISNKTENGITVTKISDGKYTIKGNMVSSSILYFSGALLLNVTHKYFVTDNIVNNKEETSRGFRYTNKDNTVVFQSPDTIISDAKQIDSFYLNRFNVGKELDSTIAPILIDLTEMFGAGNEPSSVDELYKYIVKGQYYPYVDNASRQEVNSVSMVPSDQTITNIFPNVIEAGKDYKYTAPANGYIFVSIRNSTTKLSLYVASKIETTFGSNSINYKLALLPVKKDDIVHFDSSEKLLDGSVRFANFIYAEVIQ